MKKCLVANVGNSDVLRDGEKLERPYEEGKEIVDNYEEVSNKLSFPIVGTILDSMEFDRVSLFITEQKYQSNGEYKQKDTKYLGEIIKRAYPKVPIELYEIYHNPAQYDENFEYYHKRYTEMLKSFGEESWIVYLSVSGGTPAQNTASLYHGSMMFGDLCQPLHVSKEGIHELNTSASLLKHRAYQHVKKSIERYEYEAAREVLERWIHDVKALAYVEYAVYREKFNFKRAKSVLATIQPHGEEFTLYGKLKEDIAHLLKSEDSYLLLEIYFLIHKYAARKMYIEAFSLMFRFVEGALHAFIKQLADIDLSLGSTNSAEKKKALVSFVDSKEDLRRYLDECKIDYHNYSFSRSTLYGILDFYGKRGFIPEQVLSAIQKINSNADKRNNLIYAHGYDTISGMDPGFFDGMETIIKGLDPSIDLTNAYDAINAQVVCLISDQL